MADLSPEASAILKQYDAGVPSTGGTFSPEAQTILNRYDAPATSTPDSEAYVYIAPGSIATPQTSFSDKLKNVGQNVATAMQSGYNTFPHLNVGGYDVNPLNAVAGLYRGAQEAFVQGGVPNDVVSLPDAYAGSPHALVTPGMFKPSIPKASPPIVPLAGKELPRVGGGYLIDTPAASEKAPTAAPIAEAMPTPASTPEPVPVVPDQSTVGAAQTPTGAIPEMSKGEARARQAAAEGSQLEQSDSDRRVGGIDTNQYVPGVQATLGRLDLAHAPEEAAFRDLHPEPFKALDRANNDARIDYLEEGIPGDIAIYNMKQARDAQAVRDLAPMQSSPQPVNLQPVFDLIDKQLSEGAADRGLVSNTLNGVKNTLTDGDGLKTDPNRIYNGVRKNITDMLERGKADPASNEATAQAHLVAIKNVLDNQIAETNPTFRTYLDNYTAASRPIDEAQLLGQIRGKATNAAGQMQLGRIDSVLNQLDKARNDASGANPAQSVTEDTMQRLFDLRNDLQAEAARDDMARTVGSNTHMRLLQGEKFLAPKPTPVMSALGNALEVGAHGLASYVDPFTGNALVKLGASALKNRTANSAAQKAAEINAAQQAAQQARLQAILNPKTQ